MAYTRAKTKYVAAKSVEQFLLRHPCSYYWTFTVHELLEDKEEALRRAKPLFDLIGRKEGWSRVRGEVVKTRGEYLAFWELQKRGCWHLHLLMSVWLDVNWLRDWMVKRGWGQQMRAERVGGSCHVTQGTGQVSAWGAGRLSRYLTKYLTKSLDDVPRKKPFSGSAAAKIGTVGFQWSPWEQDPTAYFWYYGRQLFVELYGHQPKVFGFDNQLREVLRLGYEATGYKDFDPWLDPPG